MTTKSQRCTAWASVLLFLAAGSSAAQAWRGGSDLELRVSSRKGGALAGARVELKYRRGRGEGPPPVATDSRGRAVILGLAPGTWQVEVKHPDYMSFVAVVRLDAKTKPEVTASFLQAEQGTSAPIRVKLLKAKGGPASPPLRVAASPRPPEAESVPATPAAPAPQAAPQTMPPTATQTAPTTEASPPASPTMPDPAPVTSEPAPPSAAPPAAEPESPAIAEEPMPTVEPEIETTAPAAPPASPPVTAEVEQTAPAEPSMPAPETPTAPSPEPAMEQPVVAKPAVAPPTEPEPDPAPAEPAQRAAQPAPEALPEPAPEAMSRPEVEPMVELAAPAETPAAMPEPPVAATPEAPMPAPESSPGPSPEPSPALIPEPAPAFIPEPAPEPAPEPEWRSYRQRTCPECRPGEWAVSVAAPLISGGSCGEDALDAATTAARMLGARAELELAGYAGAIEPALDLVADGSASGIEERLASARQGGCSLLAVALPKGSRFVGFQYEHESSAGRRPCLPDQPCPGGASTFMGTPRITRGAAATLIHAQAQGEEGMALMTVFFRALNDRWAPAQ